LRKLFTEFSFCGSGATNGRQPDSGGAREIFRTPTDIHDSSISQDFDKLHTAVRRLAALERYSQRTHSKLRKDLFE
jgi:hypothetical protein